MNMLIGQKSLFFRLVIVMFSLAQRFSSLPCVLLVRGLPSPYISV